MDDLNVREIPLDQIDEPAHAMRVDIDRDSVFDLAASIKEHGLINPITVRPKGERFEVVAGHRRYLAHRYGGIPKIKCIIRELTDEECAAVMASENYDREDTNPIDDAANVVHLLEVYQGDISRVSKIVRRGEAWIKDRLIIHAMPAYLKDVLRENKIKLGVALTLNKIENDTDREAAVRMAITQGMTGVGADYILAQWRMGIWGQASERLEPEVNGATPVRRVVTLRCRISDTEYPASEMQAVMVHSSMIGYIDALREQLKLEAPAADSSGGGHQNAAPGAPVGAPASIG